MKSKSFKKLTAVLLSVLLMFSMCIPVLTVSAAELPSGTVLYLKPNSNWTMSNARFALYVFGSSGNAWANMSDEDGDGYYVGTVPEGNWTNVIFCRMNPSATANNWNNKWNQTADLEVPDGMNCYTVKSGTWDKGGGTWSLYGSDTPTDPEETEPTTEKVVIPGDADSYYLFGYIDGANYACEEDADNAGEYKFVDGKVDVTFEQDSYVAVKMGDNSKWYMTDGWLGTTVDTAVLYDTADLGTTANKLYVPAGTYTLKLIENADGTLTLTYGDEDPSSPDEPTTDPVETDPIETEPVAVDYYLFGYINGANYGCEEDYANMGDYKFVDGTLTVTFEEAGYIGVKTTDNANWYMTDGWAGIVTEVTLYNTSVLDATADKLMVPAGEVTFTLVVNDDDTLTLSYTAEELPTIPEPETDPTTETDPSEETDPTDPAETEYVLFGYINGANYGCEEDYATIGDYKFVDGTLTATFEEDSYVAVKTSDNAGWYMTDDWQGEVTEVTLYNTSVLGETANKLYIPGGVEVTFTLVVNDDDTLTLSYVAEEEPTTEPTTEPEPTIPAEGVSIYGDINLTLTDDGEGTYTGRVDLDEGTYTFRVSEEGTAMCNGSSFTDMIYNIPYYSEFKAATTLNVSGGRYTFTYVASTNCLTVKYKPYSELVEIFGDINVELVKGSGSVFTGSARLEAGSYDFRINEMGTQMCFGYTFDDHVYKIVYNADWTSATTFNANGGLYSFKYDTETNELTVQHTAEGVGDVRIFGDIELNLIKDYGTLYSVTTTLTAGTYQFRVDELGTTYCNGSSFTESIYQIGYSSDWKSATTFNVEDGKYTFRYDTSTHQLTVLYAPLEQKVSIFGDIELELTNSTGTLYTGTVTLEAGTYAFRVDEFGITMCFGGTYTDTMSYVTYSSDFSSATTFNATGGDYTFTYNTETNRLSVSYVAA